MLECLRMIEAGRALSSTTSSTRWGSSTRPRAPTSSWSTSAAAPRDVFQRLLKEGVIVRPMTPFGMETALRVTIGTPEENRRLVKALRTVARARDARDRAAGDRRPRAPGRLGRQGARARGAGARDRRRGPRPGAPRARALRDGAVDRVTTDLGRGRGGRRLLRARRHRCSPTRRCSPAVWQAAAGRRRASPTWAAPSAASCARPSALARRARPTSPSWAAIRWPASGWLPTKPSGRVAARRSAARTMLRLVEPTSVTSAPAGAARHTRSSSPSIARTGAASRTKSASRTPASRSVVARSSVPSSSAGCMPRGAAARSRGFGGRARLAAPLSPRSRRAGRRRRSRVAGSRGWLPQDGAERLHQLAVLFGRADRDPQGRLESRRASSAARSRPRGGASGRCRRRCGRRRPG